jgi:methylated-DNA-[protein]-cysteine S-methyltransferase
MEAIVESNSLSATLTRYSVPGWGAGELWMAGEVVLAHDFVFVRDVMSVGSGGDTRAHPPKGASSPPFGTVASKTSQVGDAFVPGTYQRNGSAGRAGADRLVALLTDFLAGVVVSLDTVEIDLSWATSFQSAIANALRRIPRGEVVTYGELAAVAGYPGAARAAGSFCAGNRHALIVPCHRVVAASGIGGYGMTGVEVKRRLLTLEGVAL